MPERFDECCNFDPSDKGICQKPELALSLLKVVAMQMCHRLLAMDDICEARICSMVSYQITKLKYPSNVPLLKFILTHSRTLQLTYVCVHIVQAGICKRTQARTHVNTHTYTHFAVLWLNKAKNQILQSTASFKFFGLHLNFVSHSAS